MVNADDVRGRPTDPPNTTTLTGIGGWLGLLAFGLCFGFLRSAVELIQGWPDYLSGFRNSAAHGPLVIVGLYALVSMAAHLWAIVALFQKKRIFRTAYLTMLVLNLLYPLPLFTMLTVPGVTREMILPHMEMGKWIATVAVMGLWCWYITVSVRVKNTLVN